MVDAYGAFNYYDIPVGIDAYSQAELWFQLPLEVLLMRYNAINARANEDLERRLGRAYKAEHLKQTVVFGSSKRYVQNLCHFHHPRDNWTGEFGLTGISDAPLTCHNQSHAMPCPSLPCPLICTA